MDIMVNFSERLKILREHAGLNQSQLAEKLEVSRGSISYYENGDRIPDIQFLHKASKFFGVSYDFLLGEKSGEEKSLEDRLSLTSEAIDAIELLSRTVDIKAGYSLADVLNALLLHPHFQDLLYQLGVASDIDDEEAIRLQELTKKHFGKGIEPTVKAASKLHETMTFTIMSDIYNDFKKNPLKQHYSISKTDKGITIVPNNSKADN